MAHCLKRAYELLQQNNEARLYFATICEVKIYRLVKKFL